MPRPAKSRPRKQSLSARQKSRKSKSKLKTAPTSKPRTSFATSISRSRASFKERTPRLSARHASLNQTFNRHCKSRWRHSRKSSPLRLDCNRTPIFLELRVRSSNLSASLQSRSMSSKQSSSSLQSSKPHSLSRGLKSKKQRSSSLKKSLSCESLRARRTSSLRMRSLTKL